MTRHVLKYVTQRLGSENRNVKISNKSLENMARLKLFRNCRESKLHAQNSAEHIKFWEHLLPFGSESYPTVSCIKA